MGQDLGETRYELPVVSRSRAVQMVLASPSNHGWQHAWYCQPGKPTEAWCLGFGVVFCLFVFWGRESYLIGMADHPMVILSPQKSR